MRADDFIDTLGVNTHIGSDPYNNPAQLSSLLNFLGINNVRQSSPIDAASLANMATLGKLGAKIDLIINGGGPVNLAGAMANVNQLAPYLNAVEGPNEVAIYPIKYAGLSGVDAAAALQKDLYAAVKANPALSQASVYMFTLGGIDPGAFPSLGDLSAYTDDANIHSYPPHGLRPIFVIHAAIDGGRTDAPSKPVVVTETGFYTLTNGVGWGGVPQSLQASYLLDEVLDEAVAGVQRTYLYDLIDDGVDPNGTNQEFHFGLFNNDGTPKLAATAFHNLTTILADPGANGRTFAPDNFAFTATGVPYNYTGNTTLFQKSDGTHIIAVWNEEQLWNTDTQTAIAAQNYPVTVDLHASFATVDVIDPLLGTTPVQVLHNVSSVNLNVSDHPLLIVIPPASPAPGKTGDNGGSPSTTPVVTPPVVTPPVVTVPVVTPPVVTPPVVTPTPPGAGLVVTVSEDAYQGDAQFTVTLDGKPVGGTYTATASHSAGQSQSITVATVLGSGSHQVGISFINDAYGGSSATDRNLYVTGASYNGTAVAGAAAPLYSNGTDSFSVVPPSSVMSTAVIAVSEDAYQGDAQFTVAVDGVQYGGVRTATASHAAGQSQAVSITGIPEGFSKHDIAVTFLNDAYGGSSSTDRNLYVNSVQFDNQPVAGAAASLFSNGTQHFMATAPSNWTGA